MYRPASEEEVEEIFAKRIAGKDISYEEDLKFQTAFMLFEGEEIARRDWVILSFPSSCL